MTLDRLLAIWRAAPNKELADAIIALGAHETLAVRWEELRWPPRAQEVPALLEGVLEKGTAQARERLDAILDWPSDPRIDRWVAAQYAQPPVTSSGARPYWTHLRRLAQRVVDTHAATTILNARDGYQPDVRWQVLLAADVDRIRTKLAAVTDAPFAAHTREAIDEAYRTVRARIAAAAPTRRADADALLAAVLANPADDAPRIVLGDVLQEQGDPRGELIALQLGKRDPKRERAIIKEHAAHLLGPLHAVLAEYTFARGFVTRATLKPGNAIAIAKVTGEPLWATVEHLDGSTLELALHPVMRSLRSLANSRARLADLAAMPKLAALATSYADDAWLTLSDGLAFPALRELAVHLHARQALPFVGSALVTRLAKLDLRVDVTYPVDDVFGLLGRVHELDIPEATLRLVRRRDTDWHSAYRFTPGAVTLTATNPAAMYAVARADVAADIERAVAIVQNLGRTVIDERAT